VLPLLNTLTAQEGIVLGLVTGNLQVTAPIKLQAVGIAPSWFQVGGYGSDDQDRDKLPAIAARRAQTLTGHSFVGRQIVVIGDTPADVACGKAVGARTIGVLTGALANDRLEAAEPDHLLPDFSDLDHTLKTILAG